jgi:peptidyl-tRNA hydrolase, PTH1 family
MASSLWMAVGTGNPGARYQRNRHNVGFMVVEQLSGTQSGFSWRTSRRFSAEVAKGTLADQEVVLVKPQTFMNLSGRAVSPLAGFYGVLTDHVVVVHDDVDLELGRLRLKAGGGDGGHKGIRSIAQELGSPAFCRVRCGIGRPQFGEVEDFVLKDFRSEEEELVGELVQRAGEAVRAVIAHGLRKAMNDFNGPREMREDDEATPKGDATRQRK